MNNITKDNTITIIMIGGNKNHVLIPIYNEVHLFDFDNIKQQDISHQIIVRHAHFYKSYISRQVDETFNDYSNRTLYYSEKFKDSYEKYLKTLLPDYNVIPVKVVQEIEMNGHIHSIYIPDYNEIHYYDFDEIIQGRKFDSDYYTSKDYFKVVCEPRDGETGITFNRRMYIYCLELEAHLSMYIKKTYKNFTNYVIDSTMSDKHIDSYNNNSLYGSYGSFDSSIHEDATYHVFNGKTDHVRIDSKQVHCYNFESINQRGLYGHIKENYFLFYSSIFKKSHLETDAHYMTRIYFYFKSFEISFLNYIRSMNQISLIPTVDGVYSDYIKKVLTSDEISNSKLF